MQIVHANTWLALYLGVCSLVLCHQTLDINLINRNCLQIEPALVWIHADKGLKEKEPAWPIRSNTVSAFYTVWSVYTCIQPRDQASHTSRPSNSGIHMSNHPQDFRLYDYLRKISVILIKLLHNRGFALYTAFGKHIACSKRKLSYLLLFSFRLI